MMYWNYIVVVACILLLLFLLWKEVQRPNKAWLPGRLGATGMAVVSLACAGLPLTYQKEQATTGAKTAILLTEGFSEDSIQAFIKTNGTAPIFTLDRQAVSLTRSYLTDAGFFNEGTDHYDIVHLFGNGLNEDELMTLQIPFVFHPTETGKGITAIHWNSQLTSGESLQVQGHFKNDKAASAKIVLNAFNTALDSVLVPAGASADFKLTGVPKHLDRATYAITVLSGKDTLENEPLPVTVFPSHPIQVLLLISSPDFENKFIKNWLAQNQYPVVVRSRISKDKFSKEYLNHPTVAIDRVSSSVLSQFDVLMADATELSSLTGTEKAAIQSAIGQQGMGLVVRGDSSANTGIFPMSTFPFIQTKTPSRQLKLQYMDDSTSKPAAISIEGPSFIREQPGTQPLVTNGRSEILVSSKLQGKGKIIVTTFNNTYTWQLSGNEKGYRSFWTDLLHKAAKKTTLEESYLVNTPLPIVNEKVELGLQTAASEMPQVVAGTDKISMQQNYQLPFLWQGSYWPRKRGWQPLMNGQRTLNWMYVFGPTNWSGVRSENKKSNTRKWVALQHNTGSVSAATTRQLTIEVPKSYFFILFLLAASFLWFEKKYKAS